MVLIQQCVVRFEQQLVLQVMICMFLMFDSIVLVFLLNSLVGKLLVLIVVLMVLFSVCGCLWIFFCMKWWYGFSFSDVSDMLDRCMLCLISWLCLLKMCMLLCWILVVLFFFRKIILCVVEIMVEMLEVMKFLFLFRLISSGQFMCVQMKCFGLVWLIMVSVQVLVSFFIVCCSVISRLLLFFR